MKIYKVQYNYANRGEPQWSEPRDVKAFDAAAAAEAWAEHHDWNSADYSIIVSGSPAHVRVRALGSDTWEEMTVSGESVARYTATARALSRPE